MRRPMLISACAAAILLAPRVMMILLILLLVVSVLSGEEECPPWFTLDVSNNSLFPQCVCSDAAPAFITCDQRERASYIKIGHSAYQDLSSNTTVVARTPYIFPLHLIHNGFIRLPPNVSDINRFTCGNLQRDTGKLLCGKCINGTGPSVYSYGSQCAKCSKVNLLYYILLQYVPVTIIFVAVLVLRCSVVSPPMSHYILYCNAVQLAFKASIGQYALFCIADIRFVNIIKGLLSLNYAPSLDPLYLISPPLCISETLPEIYYPILDMLAALYPFTLLLLTYILIELHARDCKPIVVMWKFSKCGSFLSSWNSGSLIQVFATLFFLSFIKFIRVLINLVFISLAINMQFKIVATTVYTDPTVSFFDQKHLNVILILTVVLGLFVLPPIFLLMFYPTSCFRKISVCLNPRWLLTIKIFTDTFYGSFKDGTNGTRDYRSVAGYTFFLWIITPVAAAATGFRSLTLSWQVFILPVLGLAIGFLVVFEPYRLRKHNISGLVLLLLFTAGAMLTVIVDMYHYSTGMVLLGIAFGTVPHCLFYGQVIHSLILKLKVLLANRRMSSPRLLN